MATGGTAGIFFAGLATGAGLTSIGFGVGNAAIEFLDGGAVYHCARSVGLTVASAVGYRAMDAIKNVARGARNMAFEPAENPS